MLGVRVFVTLCVFFQLSSGYDSYQNYYHRHRHCHYLQQNCVGRRGPSICKQWRLVYYHNGRCYVPKYECCAYREKPGYCPADAHLCANPFLYYSTRMYECLHDYSCPIGYKCCKDSCYTHRVCKPCTNIAPHPGTTPSGATRDTEEITHKRPSTTAVVTTTTEPTIKTTRETTVETTTTEKAITTTTAPVVTTPAEVRTTTGEPITTLKVVITTAANPTTTAPVATIPDEVKTTTSEPITTVKTTTTTAKPTTDASVVTTQAEIKTTTVESIEGSGGDGEIPEPDPARIDGPNDDEDFLDKITFQ